MTQDLPRDEPRIERLIAMAERLVAALEGDIAALKSGQAAALSTSDPEIQKLTVMYGREAQGFDPRIAQAAPAPLRQRFLAVTAKFREVLQLHGRMIARVKNASEGMIQAIAREVERANAPLRTYGPRPGYAPKPPGAMVFNSVV
ncbi:MAG TPA: hypothetical protein VHC40_03765 [Rhizomicrobium sp.]|jgi:hypothetical protein|nr:hypothetical protein [Rhizomicrobium sp.]